MTPANVTVQPESPVPLFRPAVLAAHAEQTVGSLLLAQPLPSKLFTLFAIAAAAGLISLVAWGQFTRKAHVAGYVAPTQGLIKIHSRETGTIVEKHVAEGQRVSSGDVLFVVSMERWNQESVEANAAVIARVRERRASLAGELAQHDLLRRLETDTLKQQIEARRSELTQISEELRTQAQRVRNAESTLGRHHQLFNAGLLSAQHVQDVEKDVLEQQSKLQALRRTEMGLTRELETLDAQVGASELKALSHRAAIERNISAVSQELTEYQSRRTFVVTAPAAGTATAVLADAGQTASVGQPLVSILPEAATLQATLFVPSRSIGFLEVGQTVALRYQAFPYQRFGSYQGRVAEISRTLVLPNETPLPSPIAESAYRVTVTLDSQFVRAYGKSLPLQAGMLLDASIWLERRRLYEWLLDPLYSLRGRV